MTARFTVSSASGRRTCSCVGFGFSSVVIIVAASRLHASPDVRARTAWLCDLESFLSRRRRAYAVVMRTRLLVGTGASAAAVALVTGVVYALDPIAPVLGLGV